MTDTASTQRDERGDWRPANPVVLAPINNWPPNPKAITQWLFGWPGYLWPYNAFWLLMAVVTWAFLTPSLQAMQSIEAWWVGVLLARNVGFILLLFGGLALVLIRVPCSGRNIPIYDTLFRGWQPSLPF